MKTIGIKTVLPDSDDRTYIHQVIYHELCRSVINDSSRSEYLGIMGKLVDKGAQAVVLGCTEIGLLVCEEDTDIPLYDTTAIHAEAAVWWMLAENRT